MEILLVVLYERRRFSFMRSRRGELEIPRPISDAKFLISASYLIHLSSTLAQHANCSEDVLIVNVRFDFCDG